MDARIGKGLRSEFPRRFLPAEIELGDPAQVAAQFERLLSRAPVTADELSSWLLDWSELSAALAEEEAVRYIRMTCQTDDPERERAYLFFVEHVSPIIKPRNFQLSKKFLASPGRKDLPGPRYFVLSRDLQNSVDLFRDENVPLQTEEEKLSQSYQKLTGAMTVVHEDKEQTLQQMAKYLELPDRGARQAAWEKVARRRLQDRREFNRIFDAMLALRAKMSANAGFGNYRDYVFKLRGRFDYGVAECESFHAAVEKVAVPYFRELQEQRRQKMKLPALRPWDLACDALGRPPLQPFTKVDELIRKCEKIFARLDPALGQDFQFLSDHQLLDLASRKGKAPGGYCSTLDEHRVPFIFANAVGLDDDVRTLLHESGHSFHAMESRPEPLTFYRQTPLEFAEVASMSMEFLGGDYLDEFYQPEEFARSREDHLEGVIALFCWIANVDAFQHWIYTHPGHTDQERDQAWLALRDRFGGLEDWTGYEDAKAAAWHRQLHIFEYPFYYIEYGIAEVGALQVWQRARTNQAQALKDYRFALSLGGSRPLPELFQAAGIKFDMTQQTLEPLIGEIRKALEKG